MKVFHICCNLAGSTVFPQLFEALKAQGLEQEVFVPEKNAARCVGICRSYSRIRFLRWIPERVFASLLQSHSRATTTILKKN